MLLVPWEKNRALRLSVRLGSHCIPSMFNHSLNSNYVFAVWHQWKITRTRAMTCPTYSNGCQWANETFRVIMELILFLVIIMFKHKHLTPLLNCVLCGNVTFLRLTWSHFSFNQETELPKITLILTKIGLGILLNNKI